MIKKQEPLKKSNFVSLENALLNSLDNCIIATDMEGYIQVFNPPSEKTFNLSREQTTGKLKLNTFLLESFNNPKSETDLFIAKSLNSKEFPFSSKSLSTFSAALNIKPIRNPLVQVERILCIIDKKEKSKSNLPFPKHNSLNNLYSF